MVFDRLVGWDRVAQLLPPDVMTMLDARYVNHTGNQSLAGQLTLTSATPQLTIAPSAAGAGLFYVQTNGSGQNAQILFRTGTSTRWGVGKNSTAESGANAGSDYVIQRYDDTGALLGTPLSIARSSGSVTIANALTVQGAASFTSGTGASFTTSPTAPTPATADNTTKVATTAYVQANLDAAMFSASASLDFPSIAANNVASLTMTVTGAVTGDVVALGPPSNISTNVVWSGFVSAADTVTVRCHNYGTAASDSAAGTWTAMILRS